MDIQFLTAELMNSSLCNAGRFLRRQLVTILPYSIQVSFKLMTPDGTKGMNDQGIVNHAGFYRGKLLVTILF